MAVGLGLERPHKIRSGQTQVLGITRSSPKSRHCLYQHEVCIYSDVNLGQHYPKEGLHQGTAAAECQDLLTLHREGSGFGVGWVTITSQKYTLVH